MNQPPYCHAGYRIAYDGQHTYSVRYEPTGENLSHHESAADARAAAKRYHEADKRREHANDFEGSDGGSLPL